MRIHSFHRNKKALGVLESKWDPIHKKLVRRLLEKQDKVLQSCFAQKRGTQSNRVDRGTARAGNMSKWDMYV